MACLVHYNTTEGPFNKDRERSGRHAQRDSAALGMHHQNRINKGIMNLTHRLKNAELDEDRRAGIKTHLYNRLAHHNYPSYMADSSLLLNDSVVSNIGYQGHVRAEQDRIMKQFLPTKLAEHDDFHYSEVVNSQNNGDVFDMIVRAIMFSNHFCKRLEKDDKSGNASWTGVDTSYIRDMFYRNNALRTDLSILLVTTEDFPMDEFTELVKTYQVDDQAFIKYMSYNLAAFAIMHKKKSTFDNGESFNSLYIDVVCSNTVLASREFNARYVKLLGPVVQELETMATRSDIGFLTLNVADPKLLKTYAPYGFTRNVQEIVDMFDGRISENSVVTFLDKQDVPKIITKAGKSYYERDKWGNTIPQELFMIKKIDKDEVRYVVEDILDKKETSNGTMYLIKWGGSDETTWEPRASLLDDNLQTKLDAFDELYSKRPPASGGVKHVISRAIDKEVSNGEVWYLIEWVYGNPTWEPRSQLLRDNMGLKPMLDSVYALDEILDMRSGKGNEYEYYIKWKGYPNKNTWETKSALLKRDPSLETKLMLYKTERILDYDMPMTTEDKREIDDFARKMKAPDDTSSLEDKRMFDKLENILNMPMTIEDTKEIDAFARKMKAPDDTSSLEDKLMSYKMERMLNYDMPMATEDMKEIEAFDRQLKGDNFI